MTFVNTLRLCKFLFKIKYTKLCSKFNIIQKFVVYNVDRLDKIEIKKK